MIYIPNKLAIYLYISLILLAMTMSSCKQKQNEESMSKYEGPVIIDLNDPNSITKWEQSDWNALHSKIEIVKFKHFGGHLKGKDDGQNKLIGVQMCNALPEGILEQKKSLEQFLANEEELHRKVRDSIYNYYAQVYKDYRKAYKIASMLYGVHDLNEILPVIIKGDELDGLVEFQAMLVHPPKDGYSKIGIEFNCSWDEEHGLGIVICDSKVEQTGLAEVAILPYPP